MKRIAKAVLNLSLFSVIFLAASQMTLAQTLGTSSLIEGPAAGSDSVVLAASGGWAATPNAAWLHTAAGGSGNANVIFSFDANPGATRTGTLTIAGKTLTVTQAGASYVAAGTVTTLSSSPNGLSSPNGVAVDSSGNVVIGDTGNNRVQLWQASNNTQTGLSGGPPAPSVQGVAVDGSGNYYNTLTSSGNTGVWLWIVGSASPVVTTNMTGGGSMRYPYGVAASSSVNVFIADYINNAVYKWNGSSLSSLSPGSFLAPNALSLDVAGNLYISDKGNAKIKEWNATSGTVSIVAATTEPFGVAVDASGNVYYSDANNPGHIWKWNAVSQISSAIVSGLNVPSGVAVDGKGNVYFSESGNNVIKELPRAFVDGTTHFETSAAGSDALSAVLPTTENLLAPFAPASDQGWLTIGALTGGVVNFNFAANTNSSPRTAHITLLGQSISVTQSGAAGFTVTTTADSGAGSLRDLVNAVPTNSTVNFAANLSGQTISLGSELLITNSVIIDASALPAGIIINGNHHGATLRMNFPAIVTLKSLTITGASESGIAMSAAARLYDCTLTGNHASADGGGIYCYNTTLAMTGCTVSANTNGTGIGGGVDLAGTTGSFTNCTFFGNIAGSSGGGIGGGTAIINACTIYGNSAGTNGGGVWNTGGTVKLINTIVASNTAPTGPNLKYDAGTLTSGGANFTNGNAMLFSLGNFGGPTQTMPPAPGSPVIDAGSDAAVAGLPTDQRGFNRICGAHVDIGAAEAETSLVVLNHADSGAGSLRNAVAGIAPAGSVTFANTLAGQTITLTSGQLVLGNNMTIDGSVPGSPVQLNGNRTSAIFYVNSGVTAVINNLVITNGYSSGYGGGIFNVGTLTVSNLTVVNNHAGGNNGGGIENNGILMVINSTLANNSAAYTGGGICNLGGTLTVTNSTVINNMATNQSGGGIYSYIGGTVLLNNSTVISNSAPNGGGLQCDSGTVTVNRCTFAGNSCGNAGGGICQNGNNLIVNSSTFFNNSAGYAGGAILNYAPMVVNQCTIVSNTAAYAGGMMVWSGDVTNAQINQCTIVGNAGADGGGIFAFHGSASVTNCIVALNVDTRPGSHNNFGDNPTNFYVFQGGVNYTNSNVLLAALANYGGPTMTMPPLFGSPVINAGTDSAASQFATDQRGFARSSGAHVDIGAAEFQSGLVVSNISDSGENSLRADATYNAPGSSVTFAPGLSGQTISLTSGEILLGNNSTIDGSALATPVQISGGGRSRVFEIATNTTSRLAALTITGGNAGNNFGGGIYNSGTLTISNCSVVSNVSSNAGGGAMNLGVMTVNDSTFAGNISASLFAAGGGIENLGTLTVNQSTFTGNAANGGGAIFTEVGSVLTVNQSTIVSNTAYCCGGGITVYAATGNQTLLNSIVSGNSAGSFNPNLYLASQPFTTSNADLVVANPLLAPLNNYGGPTMTMPPLPGSGAIDNGNDTTANSFATDQRGYPRKVAAHVDIGAVEGIYNAGGVGKLAGMKRIGNGSTQFTFTNFSDISFSVLASTNVSLPLNVWTNLGPAVESPVGSGQFSFTDAQATNSARRFYRVKSP